MPKDELQLLKEKLELLEIKVHELEKNEAVNKVIIEQLKVEVQELKIQIEKGFNTLGDKLDTINNKPNKRQDALINALINSIGTLIGAGILYAIVSNIKF